MNLYNISLYDGAPSFALRKGWRAAFDYVEILFGV